MTGERKLELMGLDNSGKTAIVLSLKGNRNLLDYYALKPTRGLSIEDILKDDVQFHVWELGGQRGYIDKYLETFDQYTDSVDTLIFVIDVQDSDRYGAAIEYFDKIIGKFRQYKSFPKISIFLHKFDPGLEQAKEEKYSNKVLNAEIVSKIAQILASVFYWDVFKTTIYTVYRKTPFNNIIAQARPKDAGETLHL